MTDWTQGCTAGPLSDWLNGIIEACCAAHDMALDHTFDLATFFAGNWDFLTCAAQGHPIVAVAAFILVSSPIGLALYWFGPKRKGVK